MTNQIIILIIIFIIKLSFQKETQIQDENTNIIKITISSIKNDTYYLNNSDYAILNNNNLYLYTKTNDILFICISYNKPKTDECNDIYTTENNNLLLLNFLRQRSYEEENVISVTFFTYNPNEKDYSFELISKRRKSFYIINSSVVYSFIYDIFLNQNSSNENRILFYIKNEERGNYLFNYQLFGGNIHQSNRDFNKTICSIPHSESSLRNSYNVINGSLYDLFDTNKYKCVDEYNLLTELDFINNQNLDYIIYLKTPINNNTNDDNSDPSEDDIFNLHYYGKFFFNKMIVPNDNQVSLLYDDLKLFKLTKGNYTFNLNLNNFIIEPSSYIQIRFLITEVEFYSDFYLYGSSQQLHVIMTNDIKLYRNETISKKNIVFNININTFDDEHIFSFIHLIIETGYKYEDDYISTNSILTFTNNYELSQSKSNDYPVKVMFPCSYKALLNDGYIQDISINQKFPSPNLFSYRLVLESENLIDIDYFRDYSIPNRCSFDNHNDNDNKRIILKKHSNGKYSSSEIIGLIKSKNLSYKVPYDLERGIFISLNSKSSIKIAYYYMYDFTRLSTHQGRMNYLQFTNYKNSYEISNLKNKDKKIHVLITIYRNEKEENSCRIRYKAKDLNLVKIDFEDNSENVTINQKITFPNENNTNFIFFIECSVTENTYSLFVSYSFIDDKYINKLQELKELKFKIEYDLPRSLTTNGVILYNKVNLDYKSDNIFIPNFKYYLFILNIDDNKDNEYDNIFTFLTHNKKKFEIYSNDIDGLLEFKINNNINYGFILYAKDNHSGIIIKSTLVKSNSYINFPNGYLIGIFLVVAFLFCYLLICCLCIKKIKSEKKNCFIDKRENVKVKE